MFALRYSGVWNSCSTHSCKNICMIVMENVAEFIMRPKSDKPSIIISSTIIMGIPVVRYVSYGS